MAEQKYRAKERTVKKMSRDGLLEESLGSGKRKRISKKPAEEVSKTGKISTDAGSVRRNMDTEAGRKMLYEEEDVISSGEPIDSERISSADKSVRLQKQRSRRKKLEGTGRAEPDRGTSEAEGDGLSDFVSVRESGKKPQNRKRIKDRSDKQEQTDMETPKALRKSVRLDEYEESAEDAEEAEDPAANLHSSRMDRIREHSSKLSDTSIPVREEIRHKQKKKQAQKYAAEAKKKQRLSETGADHAPDSLADAKEEIAGKQKRERLNQEQRKQRPLLQEGKKNEGRLSFDDETAIARGGGFTAGKILEGTGKATAGAVLLSAHAKISEAEEDNAGIEASHHAERFLEEQVHKPLGKGSRTRNARSSRKKPEQAGMQKLHFGEAPAKAASSAKTEAEKKSVMRKFYQKQRYRRMYASAKKQEKTAEQVIKTSQNLTTKAATVMQEMIRRNSKILIGAGIMGAFFLLISCVLTSCTAVFHGTGSSVVSTTYASTDEEIHKVEDAYEDMERALNDQINGIGNRYPGYENFRYQIDEISHNPYHLISYFTAKYGEFTYEQVKGELEEIFRQQYGITTSGETGVTLTETKTVRVGESLGKVVTSGYCNCALCCGQWAGGPTASGVDPTANHTIAVDASNPFVPIGTHVVMNGVEYVVEDTGAFARYGVQFDVYYGDHASAQAHGHQSWDAYLADSNGSREIQVTTTESVNRLSVTMTNHNLDSVLRERMSRDEEKHYDIYNKTFGNRDYLFDLDTIPSYSVEGGYRIPPEALSDVKFANMIREAEKYLGYPYVWGGGSPSTSFDCSGFVSWVINNCGNGWNVGRQTAEGLRSSCAYVSSADARSGDLIFFQGTYNTPGASHVGIYAGNGMMIHCGNPIQYTSINTSYWQNHFYQFGRLP